MTSRERIFATFRGDDVDRFPVWLKMTNRTWQNPQPEPYKSMEAEELLRATGCDLLLGAGVPVLSVQPSASARCHDGELISLETRSIREALGHGLVPLVYGDVAFDEVRGGTIASTEDLFVYLVDELRPDRILLLSRVSGVLDASDEVIPQITPASLPRLREMLSGSEAVDVTGGMADKVERMVELVRRHPQTTVRILSGTQPGLLTSCLVDEEIEAGTLIRRDRGD
jgi:isopentenyl phosphate kinase